MNRKGQKLLEYIAREYWSKDTDKPLSSEYFFDEIRYIPDYEFDAVIKEEEDE